MRETVWTGDRGEGTVFYRTDGQGKRLSSSLYVAYRVEGLEHVVSAKTDEVADAKKELRRLTHNRENARTGLEPLITPKTERVTVGELLDANLRRAEEKKLKSASSVRYRTETLKRLLGRLRAVEVRPEHLDRYKQQRRGEKVGDTTIRRELEVLETAFRYAVRRLGLRSVPFIEKPATAPAREVEIPWAKFPAILKAITDDDARDFVEWMLLTGTRPNGIGELRWEWLDTSDREAWTLSVPSEKKGNAREYAIAGSLRVVIERRVKARRLGCAFIFHGGGKQRGARWARDRFYPALKACGLPIGKAGFVLYDTKRTAIGGLSDSGLSEAEVQHFTGHKTSAMVRRYCVRNADRHRAAVVKRDAYLAKRFADKKAGDADSFTLSRANLVAVQGFEPAQD